MRQTERKSFVLIEHFEPDEEAMLAALSIVWGISKSEFEQALAAYRAGLLDEQKQIEALKHLSSVPPSQCVPLSLA